MRKVVCIARYLWYFCGVLFVWIIISGVFIGDRKFDICEAQNQLVKERFITSKVISNFNKLLICKRKNFLKLMNYHKESKPSAAGVFKIARERKSDYFQIIKNNENIETFSLRVIPNFYKNFSNDHNVYGPIENLYDLRKHPTFSFGLETGACKLFINDHNSRTIAATFAKDSCAKRQSVGNSLIPISNNVSDPDYLEMKRLMDENESIFIHFVRNARATKSGLVLQGNLYIEPNGCFQPRGQFMDKEYMFSEGWRNSSTHVREVFVSTESYAFELYHWSVDAMPRLVLFLEFLQQNPSIKILLPDNYKDLAARYLRILQLDESRYVSGRVHADVVYLPQGSRCITSADKYGLQEVVTKFSQYKYSVLKLGQPRDTVILIHRTKKRFLEQHDQIVTLLRNITVQHGYRLVVFSDKALPSFNETIELFDRAAMVVAPHGAGLVNIMFSRPGLVVVEILCAHALSGIHYPYLARDLGHIYYGIRHDKYKNIKCGKMWVDLGELNNIVTYYFNNHIMKKL